MQQLLDMPIVAGLVAQERAALVTARLYRRGSVSLCEIQELTGLTSSGAWYLITKLARVLPIWYDPTTRSWMLER